MNIGVGHWVQGIHELWAERDHFDLCLCVHSCTMAGVRLAHLPAILSVCLARLGINKINWLCADHILGFDGQKSSTKRAQISKRLFLNGYWRLVHKSNFLFWAQSAIVISPKTVKMGPFLWDMLGAQNHVSMIQILRGAAQLGARFDPLAEGRWRCKNNVMIQLIILSLLLLSLL